MEIKYREKLEFDLKYLVFGQVWFVLLKFALFWSGRI